MAITVSLNSIFGELLDEYPRTELVLKEFLGEAYCLTCPGKMFDTIGNGAMIHGLSDADADRMVAGLQAVVDAYERGEYADDEYQPNPMMDSAPFFWGDEEDDEPFESEESDAARTPVKPPTSFE